MPKTRLQTPHPSVRLKQLKAMLVFLPPTLLLAVLFFFVWPGAASNGAWVRPLLALVIGLIGLTPVARRLFGQTRDLATLGVIACTVIIFLSWFFSRQPGDAFFGNPDAPGITVGVMLTAVLLFVLVRWGSDRLPAYVPHLVLALLTASQFVALVFSFIPGRMIRGTTFYLILFSVTPTTIVCLAAIGATLGASIAIFADSRRARWLAVGAVAIQFLALVRYDRGAGWITLCAGLIVLLSAAVRRYDRVHHRLVACIFVLCGLAVLLSVVRIPEPLSASRPVEIAISHGMTLNLAVTALRDAPARFFVGFGPETFLNLFAQYRSADWNQTDFWNVRIQAPASTLWQIALEFGFLLPMIMIVMIAWMLYAGWTHTTPVGVTRTRRSFVRRSGVEADDLGLRVAMIAVATAIGVAMLITNAGVIMPVLFFLCVGWNLRDLRTLQETILSGRTALLATCASAAAGALAVALIVMISWLVMTEYLVRDMESGRPRTGIMDNPIQAVQDRGYITPQIGLRMARRIFSEALKNDHQDQALAQVNNSVGMALQADQSASQDIRVLDQVIAHLLQASAYTTIPDIPPFAERARRLEPTSPVWPYLLGTLAEPDRASADAWYGMSLQLKPDYAPAYNALYRPVEQSRVTASTTPEVTPQ